jgi:hypothetical protein
MYGTIALRLRRLDTETSTCGIAPSWITAIPWIYNAKLFGRTWKIETRITSRIRRDTVSKTISAILRRVGIFNADQTRSGTRLANEAATLSAINASRGQRCRFSGRELR